RGHSIPFKAVNPRKTSRGERQDVWVCYGAKGATERTEPEKLLAELFKDDLNVDIHPQAHECSSVRAGRGSRRSRTTITARSTSMPRSTITGHDMSTLRIDSAEWRALFVENIQRLANFVGQNQELTPAGLKVLNTHLDTRPGALQGLRCWPVSLLT